MRLVCDKCTAVYTIEDGLVGQRDFRVSCKSCGKPIVVKSARQVNYAATQRVRMPGGALPPPSLMAAQVAKESRISSAPPAAGSGDGWFILKADGQQVGPLSARELASLFESGELEWGSEVWRQGLKGWRAARRDPMLVTAVAGARGVANDTTRLDAARSFLAPDDTVVEARPVGAVERATRAGREAGRASFASRQQGRTDIREVPDSFLPAPPAARPGAKPDVLPDLRPSARPQAWHSPENMAFREALGLPTDSSQGESALAGKLEASLGAPPSGDAPATTLGDAFRPVSRDPSSETRHRTRSAAHDWLALLEGLPARVMERVDSHYLVAGASFLTGVVFTALLMARAPHASEQASEQAAARAAAAPASESAAHDEEQRGVPSLAKSSADDAMAVMPVATVHQVVSSPLTAAAPPLRELPTVEELRSEVRKVAGDVRRCVDNPGRGVDVAIYLDGPSGRVRDLDVRSPAFGPARLNCVTNAVRRIQLSPFAREELKLMHKFSW